MKFTGQRHLPADGCAACGQRATCGHRTADIQTSSDLRPLMWISPPLAPAARLCTADLGPPGGTTARNKVPRPDGRAEPDVRSRPRPYSAAALRWKTVEVPDPNRSARRRGVRIVHATGTGGRHPVDEFGQRPALDPSGVEKGTGRRRRAPCSPDGPSGNACRWEPDGIRRQGSAPRRRRRPPPWAARRPDGWWCGCAAATGREPSLHRTSRGRFHRCRHRQGVPHPGTGPTPGVQSDSAGRRQPHTQNVPVSGCLPSESPRCSSGPSSRRAPPTGGTGISSATTPSSTSYRGPMAADAGNGSGGDQRAGLFGPESVTWTVHADPVFPIAGVRALLLQALHPVTLAAVAQHNGFDKDFWGRLDRTGRYVTTVTFGPAEEARRLAARVRGIHRRLRGTDPNTGEPFRLDRPDLLLWVHCCEIESFLTTARRAGAAIGPEEAGRYVAEQTRAARLIGIPDGMAPTTMTDLLDYFAAMRPALRVTEQTRSEERRVGKECRSRWS